ncbi:hypothetical protein [Synechococcus elongatus]|uniref:hypothetical protein n=1 Tax=Synechococcus elongatus TaxID=32046 RepID=UPI003F675019
MDRGTRIALVLSAAWVFISYLIATERPGAVVGTYVEDTIFLSLVPLLPYWAYRFIRAGKPSKP